LTFLYEGCKRCFYLKVVRGITPPSIPLPSVFTRIAALLKEFYNGKRTEELHPALPPGIVKYAERSVTSAAIYRPGHRESCYIKGRFDVVVELDGGTFGVIDFKTGSPSEEKHALYGRQLMAYAYALENPASGSLGLAPVTLLGLLYLYPSGISQESPDRLSYHADPSWIPVPWDKKAFLAFITRDVLNVLGASFTPESSPTCDWCRYAERIEREVGCTAC